MTGGIGFDDDDGGQDFMSRQVDALLRLVEVARRRAEDAPAHPRELRGPLEAEDSAESEDGAA